MQDAEVVVKGEIHSSKGDLDEEREILLNGVDHLILEGTESHDVDYTVSQQWFRLLAFLTQYLFFKPIELDNSVLEDIALAQDATINKTRASNLSVLENSNTIYQIIAFVGFAGMILGSGFLAYQGRNFVGICVFVLGFLLPVLMLRVHESNHNSGNRNEKMASMIVDAASKGGRVVAIMGGSHVEPVCDALPEQIEVEKKSPAYSAVSVASAKDLAYPLLVFISVLIVVYSIWESIAGYGLGMLFSFV
ncbi:MULTISPECIES: hypothetical protein [Haloarcula]|uniref:hypothetical protein n=1 Tax=Haloarcula TaxID=2237 RepID=UPI000F8C8C48|nr:MULTISPECIES: hypothetical protein [Haloarcula]NHX41402.1 hypothetical protein [Haloarcula sp. R1-2]